MRMVAESLLALRRSGSISTHALPKFWISVSAALVALFALAMSPGAAAPPYQPGLMLKSITWGTYTTTASDSNIYAANVNGGKNSEKPATQSGIDMRKVRQIRQKRERGETLTPEEAAYVKRISENRKKLNEEYKKANPPRETTGMVPLMDLGKETYRGQEGGLYPGGANVPPDDHLKAGLKLAQQIAPLDKEGNPSKDGKIVFLSIGMSNTTQEFQVFKKVADADPEKNEQVVVVDGAQGGRDAKMTANVNSDFWQVIDQRLEKANVTPEQVQVIWLKQVIAGTRRAFPEEVKFLQECLVTNLHILADRFPNLRIAYVSSRIYAGYTQVGGSPEPHAYEGGFAVKWLIADQIAGKPELNYDPGKGTVNSPWLAWGPYLWADGLNERSDGLIYLREDLAEDGMHPSMKGREKVTKQLLAFLKSDPTARIWFVGKSRGASSDDTPEKEKQSQLPANKSPDWEQFADESVGQITEFHGANNTPIAAYIRKPKGEGPFPVVVMIHGGGDSKQGTYGMGRMTVSPTASFIAEGWAVYSIDFRPNSPFDPIEWEDTIRAVETVRKMPFIDEKRVAMLGGSHGGLVTVRVISRLDLSCAIPCAPAAIDLVEVAKARRSGFEINPKLSQLIKRMEQDYGAPIARIIEDPEAFNHQSAFTEVERVRCPVLLVSGRNDSSSPPSVMEVYARKLREAGKEVELYMPDNGPHGFYFGWPRIPETEEAARRAVAFIRKHFGLPAKASASASEADEPTKAPAAVSETPQASGRIQQIQQVFRRLDRDQDGEVSGDETAGEQGARFLRIFDKNSDGTVTHEEAIGGSPGDKPGAEAHETRDADSGPQDPQRNPLARLELYWVEPDRTEPAGTRYKTFHSKTIDGDVSYLIYLPPGYEKDKQRRYPVLYWLHGSNGTQVGSAGAVMRLDRAIRDENAPPMIIVLVNGLRGATMYCDTKDGKWPLESVIINDLIPHIDATYRTTARREQRAVEGFSMGGFGAAHLGLKYPDVFGVVSILAPALLTGIDLTSSKPHGAWPGHFSFVFNEDLELYQENNPFQLVVKNANKMRGRTFIRLVPHDEDGKWLIPRCDELHALMDKHQIPHEYDPRRDVKSHSYDLVYKAMGDAASGFFAKAFANIGAETQNKPADVVNQAAGTEDEGEWAELGDGSTGRPVTFRTFDGLDLPAYLRKPAGEGPFPVVVFLPGGLGQKNAAYGMGRSTGHPFSDYIAAGWAVYAISYRPPDQPTPNMDEREWDDTARAIESLRSFPFVDAGRVALVGHSHGARVVTMMASRVDVRCAVAMAPATLNLVEMMKRRQRDDKSSPAAKMMDNMEMIHGAKILEKPDLFLRYSPFPEVGKVRFPLLMMYAEDDKGIEIAQAYVEELRKAGKEVESYYPEKGGHGVYFGRPAVIAETQEAADCAVAFIRKHFGLSER
ncbi:alpha/beta fold hydrolase [Candidatus Poribacteria bacterium]